MRLSERCLSGDPPAPEERQAARDFVAGLVAAALTAHPELRGSRSMVGLAGTVSALAMLNLGLETYDRSRVHHSLLRREDVDRLTSELASVPLAVRRRRPGLEPDRADVIIGGALVLEAVMDGAGLEQLIVSESDILDGIVAELLDSRMP